MKWLVMFSMLYGGMVVQSFMPAVRALGYAPVPVLPGLVVYYSLTHRRGEALLAAFVAGLLNDALCFVPLGYSSVVYCAVAWVLGGSRHGVFVSSVPARVMAGALAHGMVLLLLGLLLWQQGVPLNGVRSFAAKLGGGLLLGGLAVPLLFHVVDGLYGRLGMYERERLV